MLDIGSLFIIRCKFFIIQHRRRHPTGVFDFRVRVLESPAASHLTIKSSPLEGAPQTRPDNGPMRSPLLPDCAPISSGFWPAPARLCSSSICEAARTVAPPTPYDGDQR